MKPLPMVPQPAAEAPQPTMETSGLVPDPAKTDALRPAVVKAIQTVFDPEIPVNIVELGRKQSNVQG